MISLIKLSENDIRFLIVLFSVLILLFVLSGYLGYLVKKIMVWQGKVADTMMHDPVVTKSVTNTKQFRKLARKKNARLFFKNAWIPFCIILLAALTQVLYMLFKPNFDYNIFDYESEGFATLLYIWDFANAPTETFFGITIVSDWPPLLNTPTFHVDAIISYILFPLYVVGITWYLYQVQAYIARGFKLFKLSRSVFNKSLEGFDGSQDPFNQGPLPPSD